MQDAWGFFITEQLWRLPWMVLAGIGILLACRRWSRHPTVSLLILLACIFSLVSSQVYPMMQLIFPDYWQGGSRFIIRALASGLGLATSALFLAAALCQRPVEPGSTRESGNWSKYGGEPGPSLWSSPPPGENPEQTAAPGVSDLETRLDNLEELYKQGVLTEEQYKARRSETSRDV